jgi:hypothetical protein
MQVLQEGTGFVLELQFSKTHTGQMPTSGDSVKTEFVLRTQSNRAHTYGVGEVVVPNVVLFRAGSYDLSLEVAEAMLALKRKAVK